MRERLTRVRPRSKGVPPRDRTLTRQRPFGWSPAPSRAGDLDPPASERVDPAPAARDVEQLEFADSGRQRWVDDEMIAKRLEP